MHATENDSAPSEREIHRLVEGYESSGMTRRAYGTKHNIPSARWIIGRAQKKKPKLVEVEVEPASARYFVRVTKREKRVLSSVDRPIVTSPKQ